MRGVQRFFSKSVPAETVEGSTPGCAPTRTTISLEPWRSLPETSNMAAVKQGSAGKAVCFVKRDFERVPCATFRWYQERRHQRRQCRAWPCWIPRICRSEEHTSELQSLRHLV